MRAQVDAAGGDGAALAVLAPMPMQHRHDRSLDLEATMGRLAPLVEAGVTDFLAHVRVPESEIEAYDLFSQLVVAFKAGSGG
jgi:hypothetical protein